MGRKRGKYAVISDKTKRELIKMVIERKFSVPEATQKVRINYNTGKQIVQRYLNTGNIGDTRFKEH